MAGGAIRRALDTGVLPHCRVDLAVLAFEPGRTRDAVLWWWLAGTAAGGGMRLQPGVDLLRGRGIERSVAAVVLVQAAHDAVPRTGRQHAGGVGEVEQFTFLLVGWQHLAWLRVLAVGVGHAKQAERQGAGECQAGANMRV